MVWYDMAWFGKMTLYGLAWNGMSWFGMVCYGVVVDNPCDMPKKIPVQAQKSCFWYWYLVLFGIET